MCLFITKALYQLWVELKKPFVLNIYELRHWQEKPNK
jgi:hypothetical protein